MEEMAKNNIEVLEFLLVYDRYGIELEYLTAVYPLIEYTPLPCTPHFIEGVVNIRGQIISIIDIRKYFNLPEKCITDLDKLIIVHNEELEVGILADEILGIQSFPVDFIEPCIPSVTDVPPRYLRGIVEKSLIILDMKELLSGDIIVHEEI